MTFKEYIEGLQKLLEENPQCGNYLVVYASDDEGNSFHEVSYSPSTGIYNGEDYNFNQDCEEDQTNAVCIN